MSKLCIRCDTAYAVDELDFCGHCRYAFRAEIEEGFHLLQRYLACWDRFRTWCADNGVPA
jgi:hypothetical protein